MSETELNYEQLKEFPARRGFSVSYKGKTLLSKIDPIANAERLVERLPVKERILYLCPSPLYGYGLDLLMEKLTPGSAVLCVEADEKLFELAAGRMGSILREEKSRLRLIRAAPQSAGRVCAFVNETWGKRRFRRVEVLNLTGGRQLFPEFYDSLLSALQREIALSWGNAVTLIKLGRLYCRNFIRNLPLLVSHRPASDLNYGAAPVLVLGAGPSLDGILKYLEDRLGKKFKIPSERNFRIICADTCVLPLKDRGIKPDLVVILESQHWNLRDFSGARGWDIPASVIDLSALPASGRVLGGETYISMTPWTEMRLFKRLEETALSPQASPPLGSVGVSAVELAARLTRGPIVSGGIDFSFTLDAYHSRSTPGHKTKILRQNRFNPLINVSSALREGTFPRPSKSGFPVRSDPALAAYRELFEEEFGRDDRIYEIPGPGLHLGCGILSLDEAGEKLLSGKGEAAAGALSFYDEKEKEARRKELLMFITREIEKLKSIKDILSGNSAASSEALCSGFEEKLDDCDYIWAHFPECAGAGGRRPRVTDVSFLKRVRTEIDPFLKLWEEALKELDAPVSNPV